MNRNKLIEAFIGNISTAVLHKILERAIADKKPEFEEKYVKEFKNSWEIAKSYREKINPKNLPLPDRDIEEIKRKIITRVNAELRIREKRGYENLDFSIVEESVEQALREMKVV